MDSKERKVLIAELRKLHEPTFMQLGIPNAYFAAKYPHTPENLEGKFVGFYESECGKGDDIYLECVDMMYKPLDASRRLYVWRHNPNYDSTYSVKKEQYLVPVSELHVVNPIHDNRMGTENLPSEGVKRYTKTESVQVEYKEQTFVSISGARITLVWREDELFEYAYHTERGAEPSTKLSGIELLDTYNFFKTLKK